MTHGPVGACVFTAMAYKREFGEAVRQALGGRSYRQIVADVGISPAYLSDIVAGRVPSREIVASLARVLGVPAEDLLRRAGYDPAPKTGAEVFLEGLLAIERETGRPRPLVAFFKGSPVGMTVEEAERLLATIREGEPED